jgi:hypothetical protein
MAWVTPKDDWVAGDNVGNGDFNRIEGNIVDLDSRVDTLEADERGQFTLTLTGFTATHTVVVGYKKERALYTGGPSIVTLALPDTSFTAQRISLMPIALSLKADLKSLDGSG